MSAEKALAKIMLTELQVQAIQITDRDFNLTIRDGSNTKACSVEGPIDLEALALCVLKLIKLDLPEDKPTELHVVRYHHDAVSQFYYVKWSDGEWTKLNPLVQDELRLIGNLSILEKRGFSVEKIGTAVGRDG